MTTAVIRKLVVVVEETRREMGRDIAPATRKAAAIAVIANPCSDRYVEDLEPLMAIGEELGGLLGERAVAALGVPPAQVESYGKAAIVGERGELEHAAAILHPRLGAPLRQAVREGCRAGAVGEEDGRHRLSHRRAARPQGRRIRAQPLRRHGSAGGGRAAWRRDRRRRRRHGQRPAAAARWRPEQGRHQGRGRPALTALAKTSREKRTKMIDRRMFLRAGAVCAALFALGGSRPAWAAEPIRIGDINSYSGLPAFTLPYRNGWQLALAEINDKGGVLGRPLEVISRDDGGNPGNALTAANELVARENVVLLMGTFFSHVGLAVSDFAKQKKGAVHRRRAAQRRADLGEGQPLHLPAAPVGLHAGRDAGRGGGEDAGEALGLGCAQLRIRQVRRQRLQGDHGDESGPTSSGWRSSGRP